MKKVGLFLASLSLFAALCSTNIAYAEGGLAERRAIKEFQDKKFSQVEKDVDGAVGYDIALTVDWDKLARPGEAESYNDDNYFMNTIFLPLVQALRQIGKDDMGKTALKAGLKSIHVVYDQSTAVATALDDGLKFESGTLTVNFSPFVNADGPDQYHFKERVGAIVKALESKL